jgi:hypothetical protein
MGGGFRRQAPQSRSRAKPFPDWEHCKRTGRTRDAAAAFPENAAMRPQPVPHCASRKTRAGVPGPRPTGSHYEAPSADCSAVPLPCRHVSNCTTPRCIDSEPARFVNGLIAKPVRRLKMRMKQAFSLAPRRGFDQRLDADQLRQCKVTTASSTW